MANTTKLVIHCDVSLPDGGLAVLPPITITMPAYVNATRPDSGDERSIYIYAAMAAIAKMAAIRHSVPVENVHYNTQWSDE